MPNAYKRQLKDKNQDYIYPVLDPADLSGKLDKVSTTGKYQLYAMQNGNQGMATYSGGADAWSIPERQANGTFKVGEPTDNAHPTTKGYVDGGFKKLDGSNSTFEVKGGGSAQNVVGYRVLCELTPGGWSNYRLVMSVSSRHAGNGIYTITLGCNSATVNQANEYARIVYHGSIRSYQNQGGENDGLLRFYRNGTKVFLIVPFSDYDTQHYTIMEKFNWPASALPKGDGTWMESIDASVYGSLWYYSEVNSANVINAHGRITSADISHDYAGGVAHQRLDIATSSMTTNKPESDGYIQTFLWDNDGTYDTQLYLPATSYNNHVQIRLRNNGSWSNNWKSLAYLADIPDVSGYLPKSGGQMTGNLTWKDGTALPQFSGTPPYFLGMESFANGATTKWASWDTVKNGILSNGSITTAKLADKAVTPAKFDYSTKPVWSTFVIPNGADGAITQTSLRGNSYTVTRGNGGSNCSITAGASGIRVVKQSITAAFNTNITNNIGVHGILANSTAYNYYTGSSNGTYVNKNENNKTDGATNVYANAITSGGNKNGFSAEITATRLRDGENVWVLHGSIMCRGSAQSWFINTEVTAKDANTVPTFYLRGSTNANTTFCRNVIEVLEE